MRRSWKVYPNPAQQQLTIEGDYRIRNVFVYNALGQLVDQVTGASSLMTLSVQDWKAGWYLLAIEEETGVTPPQKVIIQR